MPVKIAFQQGRVREGKGCTPPRGAASDKVSSASERCEAAACGTAFLAFRIVRDCPQRTPKISDLGHIAIFLCCRLFAFILFSK
jgi:hypothetical protein